MDYTKNLTDVSLLLFDIRARLFLIQNLDPLLTDVSHDDLSSVCHDLISSFKRVSADCVNDLAKAIELLEQQSLRETVGEEHTCPASDF